MQLQSCAIAQRLRGCLPRLARAWDVLQVELHGLHSMPCMKAFHVYSHSASLPRVLLAVLLTPLPCLLAVALADAVTLAPPGQGLTRSHAFWARAKFATFVYSHATIEQIQYYVSRLGLSTAFDRLYVSVPVSIFTIAATYAMALAVGFPMPFTIPMLTALWSLLMMLFLWVVRGRFLRANRDVLDELLKYVLVMVCQMSMILLYPLFYSAFVSLSSSAQIKFVLLLPLMKLMEKNLVREHVMEQDDVKPEIMVFNIEIFNALYVSCCMQASSSINTNITIMVVDFIQTFIAMQDLNDMLVESTASQIR